MDLERLVIDNIKRIRKEKGISQEKLAEACNTATSYIGLMEIYRNVPKLSTIQRIAEALDVDPLVLFEDLNRLPEEKERMFRQKKKDILAVLDRELDRFMQ
ncbi:MAG: helix-turn-helix domain-containing protein [Treponema sp.]|jgi:transcriptional regulator with XRE-family HTH domain|nr:helix-turn-helix domain-containing protein [Treponema sp.]